MRLESSIKELHDMFMDIAMLVENQVSGGRVSVGRAERREAWRPVRFRGDPWEMCIME